MAEFTQKYGPRCPNHKVVLIKTNDPGIGICPRSGYRFEYDEEEAEKTRKLKITSFGGMVEEADWKIKPLDKEDS